MMVDSVASSSAFLAGVFTVLSYTAMIIFFSGRPLFGPINDGLSALQMIFLIPVFLSFQRVIQFQAPRFSGWLTPVAVLVLLVIAVMQGSLALGFVGFEQTLRPLMWLASFLGIWWILASLWSLPVPQIPTALAWLGIASGISFILIAVGYLFINPEHPLAAVGLLIGMLAHPLWAFWLAHWFQSHPALLSIS